MSSSEDDFKIILNIFSGQSNPSWEITKDELKKYLPIEKIYSKASKNHYEIPNILGYRGLSIINVKKDPELPETIHIFNGSLFYSKDNERYQMNNASTIERSFLFKAIERGFSDIVAPILTKLKPPVNNKGYFQIFKDRRGEFRYRLIASNGQTVLVGEAHVGRSGVKRGIESVKWNSYLPARFETYIDKVGKHRFRLKARNGRTIGVGESYSSRKNVNRGIKSVQRWAYESEIISL